MWPTHPSPNPGTSSVRLPARPPGIGRLWQHLEAVLPAWPCLAVLAGVALAGWLAAYRVVLARRHRLAVRGARELTILPPPQVDPAGAAQFWAAVHGNLYRSGWERWRHGMPHVGYEYRWSGRALTITVWVPGTAPARAIAAAARAAWPAATVTITDPTPPIPTGAAGVGGAVLPMRSDAYPLRVDHDTDPLRQLIATGEGLRHHEHACIQILARPASRRRTARLRASLAAMRQPDGGPGLWWLPGSPPTGSPAVRTGARSDPVRERDLRAALDKATAALHWQVAIRYGVADADPRRTPPPTGRLDGLVAGIGAAFTVYAGANRLRPTRLRHPGEVLARRVLRHGFLVSTAELGTLATLPTDLAVPGLARARAKIVPAPVQVPTGGRGTIPLGRAVAGSHPVALPVADGRYHTHVLGSTGSGKSTLLLNLSLAAIKAGRGVVVVDPKGDLVTDILERLPFSYADKVVLLDPDQNPPPAFNPLEGEDDDLIVDNIVSIFGKIYARHWGPRIDDILRSALLTLMRRANPMLTLVPPLLNDRQLRARLTASLGDPAGLGGFWTWYDALPEGIRAQAVGPVLARLRAMLVRRFVRRVVGQPRSSFSMPAVLDGGILLCRLPKGVLGDDTAKLLGSFVVASVWQAATARATRPPAGRRDAVLVIDECQNFLNLPRSVDEICAEARGYRLSLVLAHQNLTQLPRETAAAISANCRNKVYFTCSPEDAHLLARHTLPELDEHDLSHLDAYTAATRLVIDGAQTPAFTLATNPPPPAAGAADAIRARCAERTRALLPSAPPANAQLAGLTD